MILPGVTKTAGRLRTITIASRSHRKPVAAAVPTLPTRFGGGGGDRDGGGGGLVAAAHAYAI